MISISSSAFFAITSATISPASGSTTKRNTARSSEFVNRFPAKLVNKVKLYTEETPIFEEFSIQQQSFDKALRAKVWLQIRQLLHRHQPPETSVAIDVNTGCKFVGRGSTRLEDTIVKTNLEAASQKSSAKSAFMI